MPGRGGTDGLSQEEFSEEGEEERMEKQQVEGAEGRGRDSLLGGAEGLGLGSDGELCLDLVRLVLPGQMVCQAEELGKQREPWPCPTPMEGPSPLPPTGAWPEESA